MSNRSKKSSVPEAQSALNRFKFEVASELGVPLSEGYNGDLTSRQNGSCLLYTSSFDEIRSTPSSKSSPRYR